jgi:hypothetical protein
MLSLLVLRHFSQLLNLEPTSGSFALHFDWEHSLSEDDAAFSSELEEGIVSP